MSKGMVEVKPVLAFTPGNRARGRRTLPVILIALLLMLGITPALADTAAPAPVASGTVSASSGAAIAGATVELIRQGYGTLATAQTNADGGYVLTAAHMDGLDYRIRVWAKGYANGESTWVPLVDGNHVDFALSAIAGRLDGRVLDDQGNTVAGARVEVYRKNGGLAATMTSGADGSFAVAALPAADSYALQLTAQGYAPLQQAVPALKAGGSVHIEPVLATAYGEVSGQVVDGATGQALQNARVMLVRKGLGVVANTDVDPTGSFSFTVPAAANPDYVVRVFGKGYSSYTSANFALPGGSRRDLAGQDQITVSPLNGSVGGFVFDGSGFTYPGATVHLDRLGVGTIATTTAGDDGWYSFSNVPAASDATLRTRVLPVATGAPTADSPWFALAGGTLYEADLTAINRTTQTQGTGTITGHVTDEAGRPLALVPVKVIRSTYGKIEYKAITDDNGHYRVDVPANRPTNALSVINPTTPGYVVTIAPDGYFPNDQPVTPTGTALALVDVPQGQATTANFVLKAMTGRIAGRALDAGGKPVPGATVRLYQEGSMDPVQIGTTDSRGRYAFTGVAVMGRPAYMVSVALDGYLTSVLSKDGSSVSAMVDAAGGAGTLADLRMSQTSALVGGTVQDDQGQPVAGATVTALDPASGRTVKATTGAGGVYSLSGLDAGTAAWVLTATADGLQASALTSSGDLQPALTLNPGARATAVLRMVPVGAAIGGTVYNDSGATVAGASVEVWQEGAGLAATGVADQQGHYSFKVEPGHRYVVKAAMEGYHPGALQYGLRYVPSPVQVNPGDHLTWNPQLVAGTAQP